MNSGNVYPPAISVSKYSYVGNNGPLITAPCFIQKLGLISDVESRFALEIVSKNIVFAPVSPKFVKEIPPIEDADIGMPSKPAAVTNGSDVRVPIENPIHVLSIKVENSATNPFY